MSKYFKNYDFLFFLPQLIHPIIYVLVDQMDNKDYYFVGIPIILLNVVFYCMMLYHRFCVCYIPTYLRNGK